MGLGWKECVLSGRPELWCGEVCVCVCVCCQERKVQAFLPGPGQGIKRVGHVEGGMDAANLTLGDSLAWHGILVLFVFLFLFSFLL